MCNILYINICTYRRLSLLDSVYNNNPDYIIQDKSIYQPVTMGTYKTRKNSIHQKNAENTFYLYNKKQAEKPNKLFKSTKLNNDCI